MHCTTLEKGEAEFHVTDFSKVGEAGETLQRTKLIYDFSIRSRQCVGRTGTHFFDSAFNQPPGI